MNKEPPIERRMEDDEVDHSASLPDSQQQERQDLQDIALAHNYRTSLRHFQPNLHSVLLH